MKGRENKKFVVVTGGVISGIGKGITASSVGVLMKMLGLRPTAIKIDPYLNIDAGTMSPSEHGEVFVLDDGAETDLDLSLANGIMKLFICILNFSWLFFGFIICNFCPHIRLRTDLRAVSRKMTQMNFSHGNHPQEALIV